LIKIIVNGVSLWFKIDLTSTQGTMIAIESYCTIDDCVENYLPA